MNNRMDMVTRSRELRLAAGACLMALATGCGNVGDDSSVESQSQSALSAAGVSAPALLTPRGASSTPTMLPTRGAGPLMASARLYAIYWGDFTNAQITANQSYLSGVAGYLSGVGAPNNQEPTVRQYGVMAATVIGSITDTVKPKSSIGQAQVINEITSLQTSQHIPATDPNTLFMVFTNGITFNDGYGATAATGYCAYHSNSGNLIFSLDPYPQATGTTVTCGLGGWNGLTEVAVWQAQTSHEIQEAMTDPQPSSGWSPEVGDQCNWGADPTNVTGMTFGAVQMVADSVQNSCSNYSPYRVMPTVDLNLDGRADILWHNGTDGTTQVWYMNGTVRSGSASFASSLNVTDALGWRAVGINDFNQDGRPDLLWHNGSTGASQVWYMNGVSRTSFADFPSSLNVPDSLGWRVAGTADFNQDGMPDILWHNGTDGTTQVWYMNGISRTSTGSFSSSLNLADSTGWRLVGINDFNHDARPDILWHNGATGVTQVWYMNGVARTSSANFSASLNTPDSQGWTLVGTEDFNQDGLPDLLWHNGPSGATQVWYMNGISRTSFANFSSSLNVPDSLGWKVVNR